MSLVDTILKSKLESRHALEVAGSLLTALEATELSSESRRAVEQAALEWLRSHDSAEGRATALELLEKRHG